MVTERIATMLGGNDVMTSEQQDAMEECLGCKEAIAGEPYARDEYDEPFCSSDCQESHADRQSEKAYERFCEAFYGGEIETLDEQYRKAAEEKKRLS